MTPEEKIINRTFLEIDELATEIYEGVKDNPSIAWESVIRDLVIEGSANILLAAGMDSRVVISILEHFGDRSQDIIQGIKVNEGY